MIEKPLFIPLKAEYYEAFEDGTKNTEYRKYGPGWNEKTCRVGRAVTLSYGYGKQRRLSGVVTGFKVVNADAHKSIRSVYPDCDQFAAIEIKISR